MKGTTTYVEEPENSKTEVRLFLESRFSFDATKKPIRLVLLISILGIEKEKSGGLTAIKESAKEYFALREGFNLVIDPAIPTVTDFLNFLFSPDRNSPIIGTQDPGRFPVSPTKLKVTIYMGSGWKKDYPDLDQGSPPDLYVNLHILGTTNVKNKAKNTKVMNNCWTPSWGEEFDFPLCNTENAQLHVEVYDRDIYTKDDFAGANTLPVSQLRPGIRAVPLFRKDGRQCEEAFLLLRFMFV